MGPGSSLDASLLEQYLRQYRWRRWDEVLAMCPVTPGQRVLDLGCGPGDLSRALAMLGARVTGIDQDAVAIGHAQARAAAGCAFICADLRAIDLPPASFDAIWCSFTAAYFTDFGPVLDGWLRLLRPGGWICIVEVDDLLNHAPLAARWRAALDDFAAASLREGLYDFHAGRRVAPLLHSRGMQVTEKIVGDDELSCQGPLPAAAVDAWALRLARMGRLQAFFGTGFDAFRTDFLTCLASPAHRSACTVRAILGLGSCKG